MFKIYTPLLALFIIVQSAFAQDKDTTQHFAFSAYGDLYYSYDFSNPSNHNKPDFIYNYKRHNEFNANLLLARGAYTSATMRANVGLMFGNYAQYNLVSEPNWARFIYEANVGIKLSKKRNLWLDVGIMPSHIGFESAVSADCWTLTRSLSAENSPYYETGVKLSYTNKAENFNVAALILNGWQRLKKPNDSQWPSLGMQVNYKPNDKLTLNYSNFIGTNQPDTAKALRVFHNLYAIYEPASRWGLIAGFDIGSDKYNMQNYGWWYTPTVIVRYKLNKRLKLALRGEYFNDTHQIIIPTFDNGSTALWGLSTNLDYQFHKCFQWRLEAKLYHTDSYLFKRNASDNVSLTSNLTFRF